MILNGEKSRDFWISVDVEKGIGKRIVVNEYNIPIMKNNERVIETVQGKFEWLK